MPKPYPTKFRRDVIAVARQGGSIALIAKDVSGHGKLGGF